MKLLFISSIYVSLAHAFMAAASMALNSANRAAYPSSGVYPSYYQRTSPGRTPPQLMCEAEIQQQQEQRELQRRRDLEAAAQAQVTAAEEQITAELPEFVWKNYGNQFKFYYTPQKHYTSQQCRTGYRLNSRGRCGEITPTDILIIGNKALQEWKTDNIDALPVDEAARLPNIGEYVEDIVVLKRSRDKVLVPHGQNWLKVSATNDFMWTNEEAGLFVLLSSGTLVYITSGAVIVLGASVLVPSARTVTAYGEEPGCSDCVELRACCGYPLKSLRGAFRENRNKKPLV